MFNVIALHLGRNCNWNTNGNVVVVLVVGSQNYYNLKKVGLCDKKEIKKIKIINTVLETYRQENKPNEYKYAFRLIKSNKFC